MRIGALSALPNTKMSLQTVEAKVEHALLEHEHDLFYDNGSKQRLKFYAKRNRRLAEWVENPATVSLLSWPEVMSLALEASKARSLKVVGPLGSRH